jgi:hypothetical protein
MGLTALSSLSGSGETYYDARVKPSSPTSLHFQVGTPKSYLSADVTVSTKLRQWVGEQEYQHVSFSESGSKYLACRVRLMDEAVKVQIAGSYLNRAYGAVFALKDPSFVAMVKTLVQTFETKAPEPKPPADKPGESLPFSFSDLDKQVIAAIISKKAAEKAAAAAEAAKKQAPPSDELMSPTAYKSQFIDSGKVSQSKPKVEPHTAEELYGMGAGEVADAYWHAATPDEKPVCKLCGKTWGKHYSGGTDPKAGHLQFCPCPVCDTNPKGKFCDHYDKGETK